jgi:hypothetical protein
MKPQINHILTVALSLICAFTSAQIKDFRYKRLISEISGTWNRVVIPDEMYSKLTNDLSDLRIIGITEAHDTIEAPYILEELSEQTINNQVAFKTLNFNSQNNRYYYTFEVPSVNLVNEIALLFEEDNFDRLIKLEGSSQLIEWYTILDNYRILSINNNFTDYNYTILNFHESKYRYYRLSFQSNIKPKLLSATISEQKILQGLYRNYELRQTEISNDKKTHETIITAELPATVPVSFLKIIVQDKYDFYRPVHIQYLTDSVESPKGWIYNYSTIAADVISSLEPNEFKFTNTFLQKLRIIISNYDNEPLTINQLSVKGNMYQLVVRIIKPATYYLIYNNKNAQRPVYDLTSFKDKIPQGLPQLIIGPEEKIEQMPASIVKPIFENNAWLWIIMVIIILLLGGFTYKMIKK